MISKRTQVGDRRICHLRVLCVCESSVSLIGLLRLLAYLWARWGQCKQPSCYCGELPPRELEPISHGKRYCTPPTRPCCKQPCHVSRRQKQDRQVQFCKRRKWMLGLIQSTLQKCMVRQPCLKQKSRVICGIRKDSFSFIFRPLDVSPNYEHPRNPENLRATYAWIRNF